MKRRLTSLPPGLIILSGILVLISFGVFGWALKAALAVPLILWLPGFLLSIVLLHQHKLDPPQRLLLSIGLSLPVAGLSVLLINRLPKLVQSMPFLDGLILSGLSLLAVAVLAGGSRKGLGGPALRLPSISLYQAGLLGMAALIGLLALYLARTPTAPTGLTGYTMLWVQPAQAGQLRLGVRSEEFTPTSYRLALEAGDSTIAGSRLELQFTLKPGEAWEYPYEIPSDMPLEIPIMVRLYRLDDPDQVYRQVVWWAGTSTLRTNTQ